MRRRPSSPRTGVCILSKPTLHLQVFSVSVCGGVRRGDFPCIHCIGSFVCNSLLCGLRIDSDGKVQPEGSIRSSLMLLQRTFSTLVSRVRLCSGMSKVVSFSVVGEFVSLKSAFF